MVCYMKPLVSVIVPVFNVEAYLNKCLDSIQNQTLDAIEIIVIDDGSTDESKKIAEDIAKEDERIKVYSKSNGGLSSARNFGIEKATADYLVFVDSDDYIDPDMIELLYTNLLQENADISMCTIYDIYPGIPAKQNSDIRRMVVSNEEAIKIVFEAKITSVYAVAKLYKKSLFDTVKYPVGKIAEDAFVIVDILDQCKKVVIQTVKKYYYIHRQNSITTSSFRKNNCDVIDAYQRNYDLIMAKYPRLQEVAKMRICWANFYVLDKLAVAETGDKVIEDRVVKYLRGNWLFILKNKCFNRSRKIALCTLLVSRWGYKQLARLFIKKRGINP